MLRIYMFECRCACDDLLVMMNINSDCANGRVEPDAVDVDAKLEKWEGFVALLACCGSEISTFAAIS